MNRFVVFTMLLALSSFAAAQSNSAPSAAPAPQTIVLPGTGVPGVVAGPSTNTGTAVIIAPPSAPLLVTPEAHLTTVVPQVGASNATPGNIAGAANSTATMPVPPRISTTVPQFSGSAATVTVTPAPAETSEGSSSFTGNAPSNTGTTATGTPIVIVNHSRLFDRGVGSGSSVGTSDTGGKSLGDLARENRQHEAGVNARVYTNQDIERINQQPAAQVGGMAGAAVGAGNATGQQQQPASDNMPAVAQPSTNPPPSNPGVSQPVPPSNTPPPDQSQAIPPSPLNQMPERQPTQMAQANPPANPADQNAQGSSGTEQRADRQLPGSSSILPIMTLVGVLAAGAGLMAR
jgi:hypothetical protein